MAWVRINHSGRHLINTDLIKEVETILISTSPNTWKLRVKLTTSDAFDTTETWTDRDQAENAANALVIGRYSEV